MPVEPTTSDGGGEAFDPRGMRVLVTGASSGIGAAVAESLAAAGAVVGLCARREDRLREVLDRCRVHSPESTMWVTDLNDPVALDALAAQALDDLGGVDVLVNNAGIPKRRHVLAIDAPTVEAVMQINYLSPTRLTLALLPQMVERGAGWIVNVSSVAATLSSPGETAYVASKAALSAFSEAMAVDLWDTGVKVLVVYPGVVDTELYVIPGNDPLVNGPEPISATEVANATIDAMVRGVSQVYVPEWFASVVQTKAANLDGYLAGVADYVAHQRAGQ